MGKLYKIEGREKQKIVNVDFLIKKIRKINFLIHLQGIEKKDCVVGSEDKVILVRLDAIGDFIMSYSVFCEYRKLYQNKKLILICSASCEPLAIAWKIFDEVIPIDMKKYCVDRQYAKLVLDILSQLTADIVIQLVSNRTIEMEHIIGHISAKNKVALSRDNDKSRLRKRLNRVYNRIILYENINDFEIKKNFYLFNSISAYSIPPYQDVLPEITSKYIIREKYFVIAQGGSFAAKKWQNEKYANVIDLILEKVNVQCCLLGAITDLNDSMIIYEQSAHKERILDLTGKTTILDCVEIIRHAAFIITNDTCFIHIAAAVNTKSICIVGGWHWRRFIPYDLCATTNVYNFPLEAYHYMECFNCSFKSKQCRKIKDNKRKEEKLPCIQNISVSMVMSLVMEYLIDEL